MKRVQRIDLTGQTVEYLREQLREEKWVGALPGIQAMAAQCGVSHVIMRAAVLRLEQEGWIVPGGNGRPRQVAAKMVRCGRQHLRVMVLLIMPLQELDGEAREALFKMQAMIEAGGHTCRFTPKSLRDLNYDLNRVRRHVATQPADAWVVAAAPENILQWFADQATPAFAYGGSALKVRISATGWPLRDELCRIYRRLIELSHRRIVMITTEVIRRSSVIPFIREELAACGVTLDRYHFPEWDETPEGLQTLLASTFRVTPPTALIVDMTNRLGGVISFLAAANLRVPRDVSLVSMANDPGIAWYRPRIGHFHHDYMDLVHHACRWVNGVARGKNDRTFRPANTTFIEADSIGSPPGK